MRRRFLRKKRAFVLCCVPFLLVGGMTALRVFENEREIFVGDMKSTVEKKLSELSGLHATLGKLEVGLFQETTLEELSFRLPGERPLMTFRRLQCRKGPQTTKVQFEGGKIFWKGIEVNDLKGRLDVEPTRRALFPAASLEKAVMEGVFQRGGRLKIALERKTPLVFKGDIFLQNFLWGERRLSGSGELFFLIRNKERPWQDFKVKIAWRHLLLEDEPLENIFGALSLSQKTLWVEHLRWGESLSLTGKISLLSPYATQGRLRFLRFGREQLRRFLKDPTHGGIPSFIEGQLFLSGPLGKIRIMGNLVAHEGKIKDTDYEKVIAAFYGHWPIVTVDSRIERKFPEESSVTLTGLVDLGELGKKGFYKTLSLEGADAVVWKGVTLQNPSKETLVFGKDSQTSSVSLKTYLNKGLPHEDEKEEFQVEYKLRKDKSLKLRLKGDEEFMGLEKKASF